MRSTSFPVDSLRHQYQQLLGNLPSFHPIIHLVWKWFDLQLSRPATSKIRKRLG